MQTYSDEYLDCWGDVYVANNIADMGIPFDMFLARPNDHMVALLDCRPPLSDNGPYPLLPAQISICEKLHRHERVLQLINEGEADHNGNVVELHGDRLMTPMHHHDAPKKWKTNTRRKQS